MGKRRPTHTNERKKYLDCPCEDRYLRTKAGSVFSLEATPRVPCCESTRAISLLSRRKRKRQIFHLNHSSSKTARCLHIFFPGVQNSKLSGREQFKRERKRGRGGKEGERREGEGTSRRRRRSYGKKVIILSAP